VAAGDYLEGSLVKEIFLQILSYLCEDFKTQGMPEERLRHVFRVENAFAVDQPGFGYSFQKNCLIFSTKYQALVEDFYCNFTEKLVIKRSKRHRKIKNLIKTKEILDKTIN